MALVLAHLLVRFIMRESQNALDLVSFWMKQRQRLCGNRNGEGGGGQGGGVGRGSENTRLPPMWPGFDSQIRHHM